MTDISDILQRYSVDCQPTRVETLGSAGGLSGAQFWRLVAPRGTLALRRWPAEHPTPEQLRFIHAVLHHAAHRGIGILPLPIATLDGDTFVEHSGHLWELAPWLSGTANYEQSPRLEKLRAAMTALAGFHNAVADFPLAATQRVAGTPASITSRLARLRELQSGGIETLSRAIDDRHWPELARLARQFVATLPRVVPPAIAQLAPLADVPLPLQPCIRDIWHDHVLFDGDRVTGLIDFGAMQIDTPATDVARLLGSLVGDDETRWSVGLAAYTSMRPLTDAEFGAVVALELSGTMLAGCNWIRWIYVEDRRFDDQRTILARFSRILNRVRYDGRLPRHDY